MAKFLLIVVATILLAVIPYELNAQDATAVPLSGTTSGAVLRSMALKTVRPVYPQDALRTKKTGVAVVRIHISLEGTVTRVEVLQAPSASIGNSVEGAVAQWRFRPTDGRDGEAPVKLSGKLVFYFEIHAGRGSLLFP